MSCSEVACSWREAAIPLLFRQIDARLGLDASGFQTVFRAFSEDLDAAEFFEGCARLLRCHFDEGRRWTAVGLGFGDRIDISGRLTFHAGSGTDGFSFLCFRFSHNCLVLRQRQ